MTYMSVTAYDHGSLDFGCASYGGLAYREPVINASDTPKFICEQNLSLYWRRPGLYPRTAGFPVPLLETVDDFSNGIRLKINESASKNLRCDSQSVRIRSRNLLASELKKDNSNGIRLWAVNDFSDHKMLLQYDLELENSKKCKLDRLLRVFKKADTNMRKLELPNEAMELRAFSSTEVEGKVFVRNKHSLVLTDMLLKQPCSSTVFKSSVMCFQQIPYMQDELAVVGSEGFLFWGKMGGQFSRVKSRMPLKEVCVTDCPRVLLAISEKELVQADLRVSNTQDQIVYSHNFVKPAFSALPDEAYDYVGAREAFCHVNSLDVQLETILLTTTRKHLLIDRRMTNRAILTMYHAELDGSDYCLTPTDSFRDPKTGGQVFSLYALSQIKRPALSHWSFMFHKDECLWSSVGPKYDLDSPGLDIPVFINSHAAIPPLPDAPLPVYTRAISYQTLPQQYDTRSILFRQMDGGEIWYENILFDASASNENGAAFDLSNRSTLDPGKTSEMRQIEKHDYSDQLMLKKQSVKLIRRYLRDRKGSGSLSTYVRGVDPRCIMPAANLLEVFSVRVDGSQHLDLPDVNRITLNCDPFEGIGDSEPVATSELGNYQNIAEIEQGDGRILSSIVLQMWQKMSAYYDYNKSIGRSIGREVNEVLADEWNSAVGEYSKKEGHVKLDV